MAVLGEGVRSSGGRGLSRYSDLLLAALVVGIVAMMIIPLPTPLLDVLIATNISIAVVLLLVSIYVSDALRIAAFPSILLITTLFRLGLNVSSTRLILLDADAGTVIDSFGRFVVAGNLVVGVVIFLILTLIQFIVIAKGSERVAEVAARFTLDAMPGKQMAIDADVRAGAIDMDQARRMRGALQRESQLYGSMDGAMKFVKGDAIAGILITLINIIGGLAIGVLQRDMELAEAGRVYTLLTIGDGLVSQIPALLISTAAGIVVTRVASEDEGSHLGRDIGRQVLAQPRAIAIASGLLVLLAAVPGLPVVPFLVLGVASGALAYSLRGKRRRAAVSGRARAPRSVSGFAEEPADWQEREELGAPAAVAIEAGDALTPYIDATAAGGQMMSELIPGLRELLYAQLGIILPGVHVRGGAAGLAPAGYRILLSEVPLGEGEAEPSELVLLAERSRLDELSIPVLEELHLPGVGAPVYLAAEEARATAAEAEGIQSLDPATRIVLHLGELLRSYGFELVGIQETQALLDRFERTHPALVHEVVPKLVTVQMLSEVLRRLVEEGVSIRPLRDILQSLAEWAQGESDPVTLTEYVRVGLRRHISYRYAPDATLRALLLDPAIEDAVRDSIQRTAKGSYLAMEPELSREIVEAIRGEWLAVAEEGPVVLLTHTEVRRYVRRLIEHELPQLPVLSFNELVPTVEIEPVARVGV